MVALTSQVQGSTNMSGNAVHVNRSTLFKRIGIGLFAGVLALTMVLSDAQARRLGGGRSMGTQSQSVQRSVAPAAVRTLAVATEKTPLPSGSSVQMFSQKSCVPPSTESNTNSYARSFSYGISDISSGIVMSALSLLFSFFLLQFLSLHPF